MYVCMYVSVYIYIYILRSLSLSQYIYICIWMASRSFEFYAEGASIIRPGGKGSYRVCGLGASDCSGSELV